MNYYRNYPTHRLYFGELETPYRKTCTAATLDTEYLRCGHNTKLLKRTKVSIHGFQVHWEYILLPFFGGTLI